MQGERPCRLGFRASRAHPSGPADGTTTPIYAHLPPHSLPLRHPSVCHQFMHGPSSNRRLDRVPFDSFPDSNIAPSWASGERGAPSGSRLETPAPAVVWSTRRPNLRDCAWHTWVKGRGKRPPYPGSQGMAAAQRGVVSNNPGNTGVHLTHDIPWGSQD